MQSKIESSLVEFSCHAGNEKGSRVRIPHGPAAVIAKLSFIHHWGTGKGKTALEALIGIPAQQERTGKFCE